jgi:autotransporter passenger strand-loop-strand repeat protein
MTTIYTAPPNVSNLVLAQDDILNINSGGTATNTTVENGSVDDVNFSGTASDTNVYSGAGEFVASGGTAIGTTLNSGAEFGEFVDAGGTAIDTLVLSNADQDVDGGTASGTRLIGGALYVYAGGKSIDTAVSSGGTEYVSSGSTASGTRLVGGTLTARAGDGTQIVYAGGSAVNTVAVFGGETVYGTTTNTVLDAAFLASSGGEQVLYDTYQYVSSGGITTGTTVNNLDFQEVRFSGQASGTTVNGGGTQDVNGTTINTILSGGVQNVFGSSLFEAGNGTATGTTVDSGGQEFVYSGGTTINTRVNAGGHEILYSNGTTTKTTVNSGAVEYVSSGGIASETLVSSDGFEYVSSGGLASETLVSSGGFEVISAGGSATSTRVNNGGFEVIYNGGSATDTDLLRGGTIDVAYLSYAAGGSAGVNASDLLTVSVGGHTYSQQLTGQYSGDHLVLESDSAGGTDIALCFCHDTMIATPAGEVKVQHLAVGDQVLTQLGTARPIVWIGTGRILATRGRRNAATPVIVRKGALADNVPARDLRVTKSHSLLVDGALIPVEYLVNHRSIEWDDRAQEVRLYHIELETHDVLIANGAPAESYRDDGNRWLFRNANTGWAEPPKPACGPVLTGGSVVDQAWRRLLDRSGPRPSVPMTGDPDLHLVVDGQRVDATDDAGGPAVFSLAERPNAVRIVSRASVPQELGIARDPRCLGVALRWVVVRQGTRFRIAHANDPRLVQGFHDFEAAKRCIWTDGDAAFPMALLDGLTGPMEIVLTVVGGTNYIDGHVPRTTADGAGSGVANRSAA